VRFRSLFPLVAVIGTLLVFGSCVEMIGGIGIIGDWMVRASVVLALVFVAVAARNLRVLSDERPRFGAVMSVVWCLIPVVNVVMVHQVLTALWQDSQTHPPDDGMGRLDLSVAAVNVWWGLALANVLVPLFDPSWRGMSPLVGLALWFAAEVAFVGVIAGIAVRQREQWIDLARRRSVPAPTADALR
jgi:hypothetical protein